MRTKNHVNLRIRAGSLVTILWWLVIPITPGMTQDVYKDFREALRDISIPASDGQLDKHWNTLVVSGKIPLVGGDSVAFLYRGQATSVAWMGDFNGWGSNKIFDNKGKLIPGTDIWVLKSSLPPDARLDYKILINDRDLILDPVNASSQWSGVGGGSLNSELRMPAWTQDPLTSRALPDAPRGHVARDLLLSSRELGYQITYNVYTPAAYDPEKKYPVVFVTDGYEYMHEQMGNMVTALDNLIYLQKVEPVVAVFIDHREPVNRSLNRRMQELGMNEKYSRFLGLELVPAVEGKYSVSREPSHRGIVGTSLGGLSAAWLTITRPDLFGKAGIQSPAFWFKPNIYSVCGNFEANHQRIFLSTGLINDAEEGVRKMREILDRKSFTYEFKAVNQGHSWGNWRDLVDDMLVYLYPGGAQAGPDKP